MGLDWKVANDATWSFNEQRPVRLAVDLGELDPRQRQLKTYQQYIEQSKKTLEANPNDADACNTLAWALVAGPPELRNAAEALNFARNSVRLRPEDYACRNTLGVAHYRLGEFELAIEALRRAVELNHGEATAFDLSFLAMSHHRLSEMSQARLEYEAALNWWRRQAQLPPTHIMELTAFQSEADEVLGETLSPTVP
jgi:tetratricopeptide (TPR) repeat protein